MNADPAVEPELDAFSLILPLPYRIAVIVVLGMNSSNRVEKSPLTASRCLGLGS